MTSGNLTITGSEEENYKILASVLCGLATVAVAGMDTR